MGRQVEPGALTDAELAETLMRVTKRQIDLWRARRLKQAVIYKRYARVIGNEIRERVKEGSWHG